MRWRPKIYAFLYALLTAQSFVKQLLKSPPVIDKSDIWRYYIYFTSFQRSLRKIFTGIWKKDDLCQILLYMEIWRFPYVEL